MKKNEIKIGHHYAAKVSGQLATVRIDAANDRGGWDAVNLRTGKSVRIKSAQRLRHETRVGGEKTGKDAAEKAEPGGQGSAHAVASPKRGRVAATADDPAESTPEPKAPGKRDTGERRGKTAKRAAKAKRPSGLDAAAQVLAEAREPLNTKDMVERMLAQGLWKTNGKTPAATIYAAITREIKTKGEDARFRKVARGKFELAG